MGPHWELKIKDIRAIGVDIDMSHSDTSFSDVAGEADRHVKETDKEMR